MKKFYTYIVLCLFLLFGVANHAMAETLTVSNNSNTNNDVPIKGNYVDTKIRCQIVYPPSDLSGMASMSGKNITGIKFYLKSSSTFNAKFYVRLAEISGTGFDSKVWFTDELTDVYSGVITPSSTEVIINFSTPYLYTGGNLLVDIQTQTTGTWNSTTYYGNTSLTTKKASAWAYNGSVTTPYSTEWFLPKTTFTYETASPLTCPKPTLLTKGSITSSSASFTWAAGGTETQWQYVCLSASTTLTDAHWASSTLTSSTSATITGLSASTDYKFYVRAYCDAVDQSGPASISFSTPCAEISTASLPWSENFESVTTGSGIYNIPDCWGKIEYNYYGTSYPYVYNSSGSAHGGNKYLHFYGGGSTSSSIIILPKFEAPTNTLKISFWYKTSYENASYGFPKIGYMTDPTNAATFTSLKTLSQKTSYTQESEFSLSGAPADSYIAIQLSGGSYAYQTLYIDDLTVASAIDCGKPSTPTKVSTTGSTATLSWTANAGVSEYKYVNIDRTLNPSATPDWSSATLIEATTVTLTELVDGHNYDFYIMCACGDTPSDPCNYTPVSCPTVTGVTLTNERYNSVRVNWTTSETTNCDVRYKAGSGSWNTTNSNLSAKYLDISSLTSGTTYTIEVKAHCAGDEAWVSRTYTPVCNTPGAITLTNQTYNSVRVTWAASGTEDSWNLRYRKGSDSWTERNGLTSRQCDLTGLVAGEEYTIEVTAACCTSGTRSTTYTPVCPTPGTITLSNKTHSSVRVTWAAGGTEDSWNLRYKAAGGAWSDDSGAATGLTTKQYDITGLTSDVEYTIEVSAGCCTGSARSTTYTPICATPASASVTAIKDATASASWSAAAGTGITTFQYIVVPRDATPDWSAATTKTGTSATLSGLTVATNYDFYVRSKCADGNFSESLKRQFTTTAQQPGTITVNSVTSDGGRFSWTAGGAETQYQWKTSAAGSDWSEPLPAGTRTVTVTGLNPTTTYTFYVRSYYSAGVQSAARSTSFTTTCGAESMPFIEDFNSIAENTIPTCWDNTEGTTTYDRYKWTGFLTGRTGKCVRFNSYNNPETYTNFLKTPPINVDKSASLFFWYKNPTGGDFSVYYSIDGGAQTLLASGLTGKTSWTQATYALPAACVGHSVTIIFKGTSNYGSGDAYIYLDDVEVKNCDTSTIYFDACDGTPASTSLTASRCTGIVLPTVSGQCEGWTLAGWATEPVMEATSSLDATIYAAGSRYYPLVDTDTLYAVYSKAIGTSNNYARVNTPSEITLGSKYIIVYYYSSTNYAMSSTLYYSTYSPNGKSVTPNGSDIITTTDATIIWQISGSSLSNCTISNTASNKYLSFKKVSNEVAFASPSDGDNFTIAQNTTSLFSIKSNSSVSYPYLVGSSNTFTNSSSNSNSKFKIYKNVTTYSYTSYPCSKEVLAAEWEEISGDNFSIVESLDYDGSPTIKSTLHIAAIEPATEGRYSLQYTARPGDHIVIGWGSDMYRIEVPYIATSSITPEVPTGKDLHILPGATFTVSSDMTLHNVSVYGDGELIVGSGSTLTVDTLILCAEQSRLITLSAPEVTINGTFNITTNTLLHDRRIDYHEYYMMTLPFDSRLSDIQYAGLISKTPIAAPIYYTDYFMQYYDTETRNEDAESGERAILGGGSGESYLAPTYWTHVVSKDNLGAASTYVLKAGRGYTIGISDKSDAHSMRTLRFKMTVPSGWNNAEKGLSDKVTDIVASPATSGDFQRLHSGWNLIGNPYLHNYSTGSATASSGLVTGTYILDPLGVDGGDGRYHLSDEGTDVPYITFFDYSWGTYYQTRVSETTFKTFAAAFIQVADGNEQLCFSTPIEAQSAMPAYRRVAQKGKVTYTGINLYNEQNNTSDNTGLVISDDYTTDYETGADLAKMRGNNSLAVFSITNKTELAYNAIDEDYASKTIPLGVCLPQNGEYTFTFDNMRYNVADVKEIILTDYQENTSVNLLWEDYSFVGNKGTDNKRFALTVVLPQNSPSIATDVETASNEKPYCYGTSEGIVCNVAEQYSIYVFDMTGKKVAGLTNVNGKQHIRLANGIYNVMVCTPTTQHTQRCVVR